MPLTDVVSQNRRNSSGTQDSILLDNENITEGKTRAGKFRKPDIVKEAEITNLNRSCVIYLIA